MGNSERKLWYFELLSSTDAFATSFQLFPNLRFFCIKLPFSFDFQCVHKNALVSVADSDDWLLIVFYRVRNSVGSTMQKTVDLGTMGVGDLGDVQEQENDCENQKDLKISYVYQRIRRKHTSRSHWHAWKFFAQFLLLIAVLKLLWWRTWRKSKVSAGKQSSKRKREKEWGDSTADTAAGWEINNIRVSKTQSLIWRYFATREITRMLLMRYFFVHRFSKFFFKLKRRTCDKIILLY